MEKAAALLIVDLQNDFCPGGALPVADGNRVVEPLNRAAGLMHAQGLPVLASRDWHPPQTGHFREYGGQWPVHCVQGSYGAGFHPDLRLPEGTILLHKGGDPLKDGYSAFEAETAERESLEAVLNTLQVRQLYVGGLATDYCVRNSVMDALQRGFRVTLLTDAVAGVDLVPGDSEAALEEMRAAGAEFCTSAELLRQD